MGQEIGRMSSDDLDQFEKSVDRILNSFFPQQHRFHPISWHPPTDVFEMADSVVVKIEIAGMKPEDFSISYAGQVLTVTGERHDLDENKRGFHMLEIAYGAFEIQVHLPGAFVIEQMEAKYEQGFLYVTLPKPKEQAHTAVQIRVK